jgi:hypothetical protein
VSWARTAMPAWVANAEVAGGSAVQHDPVRFACPTKATRRRADPFGFAFTGFAAFSRRAAEIFIHEDLAVRRAHEYLFRLTDRCQIDQQPAGMQAAWNANAEHWNKLASDLHQHRVARLRE